MRALLSRKYGLITSRYSLGDKFLSLSPLLSYSMYLPLKALLLVLLVFNSLHQQFCQILSLILFV